MVQAKSFVIVHGAFQSASAWKDVAASLKSAGHQVDLVDLPGRDAKGDLHAVSLELYRDAANEVVRRASQRVVLVGHSFGGFVTSSVAEANSELIERLVYVAAYVPSSGESLQSLSAQDRGSKFSQENFVMAPDYSYAEVLERDRALIFANDAEGALRDRITAGLLREPLTPLSQAVTLSPERFGKVAKSYVKTRRDNAVSPAFQDMMIARAAIDRVLSIDAGHAAAQTQPDKVARLISEAA